MGMTPLALLLKNENTKVFGFDNCPNPEIVSMLKANDIEVFADYDPSLNFDSFIITTAMLNRDFKGQAFTQRGQAFAEFCATRKLVAIVGSHGKTSVTNMCSYLINSKEDCDIGYMLGAMPCGDYLPAKTCTQGSYILAEIDESDATIENFSPEICCALNFDLDHTNTYANKADLLAMFERLFDRTKGKILVPKNSKELCLLAENSGKDYLIVETDNTDFDSFNKSIASALMGIVFDEELSVNSLKNFKGTKRRQEILLENDKLIALADYAHHPSEVEAFFKWLNAKQSAKKIIFFQPHRYTRTKQFHETFKNILLKQCKNNSKIYLLPVYAASETFDANASSELITQGTCLELIALEDMKDTINKELKEAKEKVCLAFVGAGDVYFKAKDLL